MKKNKTTLISHCCRKNVSYSESDEMYFCPETLGGCGRLCRANEVNEDMECAEVKKDIIEEFLESTPLWVEQMQEFKDKPCVICGTVPTKMVELVKAIEELQEKAWRYDQLSK